MQGLTGVRLRRIRQLGPSYWGLSLDAHGLLVERSRRGCDQLLRFPLAAGVALVVLSSHFQRARTSRAVLSAARTVGQLAARATPTRSAAGQTSLVSLAAICARRQRGDDGHKRLSRTQ